jgi:hypothetical protein
MRRDLVAENDGMTPYKVAVKGEARQGMEREINIKTEISAAAIRYDAGPWRDIAVRGVGPWS